MRWENVLIVAFILTLILIAISGLYIFEPRVWDVEIVYFGFPFPWLEAIRSTWAGGSSPWHYEFLSGGFFVDFLIYGLIAAIAMIIYEKMLERLSKAEFYRKFFWLSAVLLVVCCCAVIFWNFLFSSLFSSFFWNLWGQSRVVNYRLGESFLRFLLGLMTIIFTWFLIHSQFIPHRHAKNH